MAQGVAEKLLLGDTELEGEEEKTEAVVLREGEWLGLGLPLLLRVPLRVTQDVALEVRPVLPVRDRVGEAERESVPEELRQELEQGDGVGMLARGLALKVLVGDQLRVPEGLSVPEAVRHRVEVGLRLCVKLTLAVRHRVEVGLRLCVTVPEPQALAVLHRLRVCVTVTQALGEGVRTQLFVTVPVPQALAVLHREEVRLRVCVTVTQALGEGVRTQLFVTVPVPQGLTLRVRVTETETETVGVEVCGLASHAHSRSSSKGRSSCVFAIVQRCQEGALARC